MASSSTEQESKGLVQKVRSVFWTMKEDEISRNNSRLHDSMEGGRENTGRDGKSSAELEGEFTRGGGGKGKMQDVGGEPGIEAGERSERWFDRIEQETVENRKMSNENKNLLMRMDYRTIWIARLLLGVVAAIIAGAVLNVVF